MKRFICILLALLMLLGLTACGSTAVQSQRDSEILAERRDQAESFMRQMATVLWRAEEDITYSNSQSDAPTGIYVADPTYIVAGRLYRGLPYSHAASDTDAFLEFAGEPDDKGIYSISGLTWHSLHGKRGTPRIGNDCASAVGLAWGTLGNSLVKNGYTKELTEQNGYLRVGEYESPSDQYPPTFDICEQNGLWVMYNAYAQLQKADAVVMRNKADNNGHTMMIVTVEVVKTNGEIDGQKSYVTVLEQTSGYIEKQSFNYDETLGENVYQTYAIDKKYTFMDLYASGYLPITCKELIDPSPVVEPGVTDTITEHSYETIIDGALKATRFIGAVTVIISDANGDILQQCATNSPERNLYDFDMQRFATDEPEVLRGSLDMTSLDSGTYHCKVICRLVSGDEFTVRDFDFTK